MQKAVLTSLILASGCFSATTGVRGTAIVDQEGNSDTLAVATLGVGYSINQNSAVALEVEVGSSLDMPLFLGESLSYTRLTRKRGWHTGIGFEVGRFSSKGQSRRRIFGEYLIPFGDNKEDSKPSSSSCLNDKGCFDDLFPSVNQFSSWTVGFGPELYIDIDDDSENAIGVGVGVRVAWFGFQALK